MIVLEIYLIRCGRCLREQVVKEEGKNPIMELLTGEDGLESGFDV